MNFVTLVGRLVKDPELRRTVGGDGVATFTLAISENKEHTDFIDCRAFKQNAENLVQYKKKGDLIAVSGKIRKDVWKGGDKKTKSSTYVIANYIEYLANAKANEGQPQLQQSFASRPSFNNNQPNFFDSNSVDLNGLVDDDDLAF